MQQGTDHDSDVLAHFESNASILAPRYDSVSFDELYAPLLGHLPSTGRLLDVGCGSGRDAAALARMGLEVTAVDATPAMIEHAAFHHAGLGIDWRQDRLPELASIDARFEVVWCCAVWMFLAPEQRAASMARLADLVELGGRLFMSLRHGPSDGRPMHDVSVEDLVSESAEHGLRHAISVTVPDAFGRDGVDWTLVAFER